MNEPLTPYEQRAKLQQEAQSRVEVRRRIVKRFGVSPDLLGNTIADLLAAEKRLEKREEELAKERIRASANPAWGQF